MYIFNPSNHDTDPNNIQEFGSYTTGSSLRYTKHFVTTDCIGFKYVVAGLWKYVAHMNGLLVRKFRVFSVKGCGT